MSNIKEDIMGNEKILRSTLRVPVAIPDTENETEKCDCLRRIHRRSSERRCK